MNKRAGKSAKGFLKRLGEAFGGPSKARDVEVDQPVSLEGEKLRVACGQLPLAIDLGEPVRQLHLVPDRFLDGGSGEAQESLVLLNPDVPLGSIGGFLRLNRGESLVVGRADPNHQALFDLPQEAPGEQLVITHCGASLVFENRAPDSGVRLLPLPAPWVGSEMQQRRRSALALLREIYGGPIVQLPTDQALATLREVNDLLEREPLRAHDEQGRPGSLIRLPDRYTPIVVGDLHAQVDNLLTLLTQNEFLEAMGDGTAAMVFLGDAVHKEVDGEMEEMDSSLLIMDLIFRLKLWFPQQVFYIRGNHDCFLEDIGKDGIPQGLLWDAAVRKARGDEYKREMDRFYDLLPYVAVSADFAACHAGPPRSKATLELLVNARNYPGLTRELTCNRLYAPNRPGGYTKGDVKRLRKTLGLPEDAPLFVGHTPMDRVDTLWLEVGRIPHHHVVFSGNRPWIGVFTRVRGRFIPLRYLSESLLPLVNEPPGDARETAQQPAFPASSAQG